ncbi:cytochrome protein [Xylariales sp. PMI_506]|nr:cytochrome protein [Xylariales sp. PMI_506]
MDIFYLQQHQTLLLVGGTFALFLVGKLVSVVINVYSHPLSNVPGPWYAKWTGLVDVYVDLKGYRSTYIDELHKAYGPAVRTAPDFVSIADLPSAKRIHTVKADYIKGPAYKLNGPEGKATVFSTTDVVHHRERRRLLSGPLAESSVKTMIPIVETRCRQVISRMDEQMKKQGYVDVFAWWFFFTTDIIGELSFGESFRMIDQGKKNQYLLDLESLGGAVVLFVMFPFLVKLAKAGIPIPIFSTLIAKRERLNDYAQESVERYKRQLQAEPENPKPTLFTKLYKKAGEGLADGELEDDEIRNEAALYIVAGSDTTSNTLTFLVWLVCRHPEVKQALVDEVAALPDDFGHEDLVGLRNLNNVIEETLRLYPSIPAPLPRVVPTGGATLAGYFLPGGTNVATQAWSMHRLEDVYPEPERFNPSRWDAPTQAMKDAFMAFGGGSRICIGLHLARIEMRLAVARFFRTFPDVKMSNREGMNDADMIPLQYFLMRPTGKRCLVELY